MHMLNLPLEILFHILQYADHFKCKLVCRTFNDVYSSDIYNINSILNLRIAKTKKLQSIPPKILDRLICDKNKETFVDLFLTKKIQQREEQCAPFLNNPFLNLYNLDFELFDMAPGMPFVSVYPKKMCYCYDYWPTERGFYEVVKTSKTYTREEPRFIKITNATITNSEFENIKKLIEAGYTNSVIRYATIFHEFDESFSKSDSKELFNKILLYAAFCDKLEIVSGFNPLFLEYQSTFNYYGNTTNLWTTILEYFIYNKNLEAVTYFCENIPTVACKLEILSTSIKTFAMNIFNIYFKNFKPFNEMLIKLLNLSIEYSNEDAFKYILSDKKFIKYCVKHTCSFFRNDQLTEQNLLTGIYESTKINFKLEKILLVILDKNIKYINIGDQQLILENPRQGLSPDPVINFGKKNNLVSGVTKRMKLQDNCKRIVENKKLSTKFRNNGYIKSKSTKNFKR